MQLHWRSAGRIPYRAYTFVLIVAVGSRTVQLCTGAVLAAYHTPVCSGAWRPGEGVGTRRVVQTI